MSIYDEYYETVATELTMQCNIANLFYQSDEAIERLVGDTIDRFLAPRSIDSNYSLGDDMPIRFRICDVISGLPALFQDLSVTCVKHDSPECRIIDIIIDDNSKTIYFMRISQIPSEITFHKIEMEETNDYIYNRIKNVAFISLRQYINTHARY